MVSGGPDKPHHPLSYRRWWGMVTFSSVSLRIPSVQDNLDSTPKMPDKDAGTPRVFLVRHGTFVNIALLLREQHEVPHCSYHRKNTVNASVLTMQ